MEINELIIREMNKRHMTGAELARKLNLSPRTVSDMLTRGSLQINRLIEVSKVIEYDFFQEISDSLAFPKAEVTEAPLTIPSPSSSPSLLPLQERIKELEIENGILRKMLKI